MCLCVHVHVPVHVYVLSWICIYSITCSNITYIKHPYKKNNHEWQYSTPVCISSTSFIFCSKWHHLAQLRLHRWPSGQGVRLGNRRSGVRIPLATGFFRVESYQWLKNWHSSGYPAWRLALYGQRWDWSAQCQCTVTGWGRKFDLQLLSQCGST